MHKHRCLLLGDSLNCPPPKTDKRHPHPLNPAPALSPGSMTPTKGLLTPETPGTIKSWDKQIKPRPKPNTSTAAMPGSGKQTAPVQQQIIEFLEAGIDPTTIHRRLKVGRSSIYRMKRCLQQHGTAYAPPETNKKNGRPKVMTAEQEQVCCVVARCDLLQSMS
jgi:hypothetical protein